MTESGFWWVESDDDSGADAATFASLQPPAARRARIVGGNLNGATTDFVLPTRESLVFSDFARVNLSAGGA